MYRVNGGKAGRWSGSDALIALNSNRLRTVSRSHEVGRVPLCAVDALAIDSVAVPSRSCIPRTVGGWTVVGRLLRLCLVVTGLGQGWEAEHGAT